MLKMRKHADFIAEIVDVYIRNYIITRMLILFHERAERKSCARKPEAKDFRIKFLHGINM